MKNNIKKVIVAHPAKQHSYHLATALKKEKILYKYITTVYDKENSFTRLLMNFLNGDNLKRANTRHCEYLENDDVVQFCELRGLFMLFLYRINKKLYRYFENNVRKSFGIKVAKYAIKNNVDAIIVYDTQAFYTGKYLKKKNSKIKLIMDVSAANLKYMKEIYEHDIDISPDFAKLLYKEREYLWKDKAFKLFEKEIEYIDYFLAPSNFVKKSLMFNNIDESSIYICHYGANFNIKNLNSSDFNLKKKSSLEIVFIGNVAALKGISYLLKAINYFKSDEVKLKLIGHYDNSQGTFNSYFERCEFMGRVTHDKVQEICSKADIFILPSLGEGMSLAGIEALSMGLPCIVSENSGINDIIVDEYNGFVVPVQDVNKIVEKIRWFLDNKNRLPEMKKNSIETAKKLTWEIYEKNITSVICDIIES